MREFSKSRLKSAFKVTICMFASLTMLFSSRTSVDASDIQRLHAVYEINFNNFDLGTFKFWSEMSNNRYSILGKGDISILSGIFFNWKATTKSSGKLTKKGPKPKSFSFQFEANSQTEKINIHFRRNAVTQVIFDPPRKSEKLRAPFGKDDLKKVFDPMSALIALTSVKNNRKGSGHKVCKITLPVFDGKERYNLVMSHKRTVHMSKSNQKGYSGPAYICRVRYIPISGHELDNEGTKYMANSDEIEIWMVPVPNADFNLPYHIVIPTQVGYVSATSQMFQVEKPDGQIAFVN